MELYRFRPLKHCVDELEKSYLYFSPMNKLNDPMEGICNLKLMKNESEWEEFFLEFVAFMYPKKEFKHCEFRQITHIVAGKKIIEWQLKIILYCVVEAYSGKNIERIIAHIYKTLDIATKFEKNNISEIMRDFYAKFYNEIKIPSAIQDKIYRFIEQIRQDVLEERFVCSFSKHDSLKPQKPIYENSVMWAHYADLHNGICLEFDKIALVDYPNLNTRDIRYSDNAGYIKILNRIANDSIFTTKRTEWEYENESRFLLKRSQIVQCASCKDDNNGLKIKYEENCLKSITFGIRTAPEIMRKIMNAVKNRSITFYQMLNINGNFKRIQITRGL